MAGTVQGSTPLGGTLQSQATEAPVTAASLPNIKPEPDFIFFVNPARWDIHEYSDGTQELLPTLSKLKLDPGVGGVTETGDYTYAKARRMRDGQIEVPRMYGPDDYVAKLRVRSGWLFHERWRKFIPNGSQIVERHREAEHDAFLHFLHDVCAGNWPALPSGIPAPIPEVIEGRQELYRAKLIRQVEQAGTNPMKAASAEATQARIEALQEFKDNLAAGSTVIPPKPGKQTLAQKLKATVTKKPKVPSTDVPDAEG